MKNYDEIRQSLIDIANSIPTGNQRFKSQLNNLLQEMPKEDGELSDGNHTFDELYYHRMVLFAVICNSNKHASWKSWLHDDGTMFEGYFIVGITTPEGPYTYHCQKQYWDLFEIEELPKGLEWDGHQPKDVTRLLSLMSNNC